MSRKPHKMTRKRLIWATAGVLGYQEHAESKSGLKFIRSPDGHRIYTQFPGRNQPVWDTGCRDLLSHMKAHYGIDL